MTIQKETALYLKGVVIANSVPDTQGDILNKTDIKKVYTNFLNPKTDLMHTYIENSNVYVLSNYISEVEETINNRLVPVGSWISEIMVLNEDIKQMITDKKLNGFSLGSIPRQNSNENYFKDKLDFLNKPMTYRDLDDAEDINPLFISLVDNPANTFLWEVYDYNGFINKKTIDKHIGGYNLAKEQINILNKVLDFINKSDEPKKEEEKIDETKPIDKEATTDDTTINKPEGETSDKTSEINSLEEKLEAFMEDQNKKVDTLLAAVSKLIDNKTEDTEKPVEPVDKQKEEEDVDDSKQSPEEEDKDSGKINKRTTHKLDGVQSQSTTVSSFNDRTGRTINGFKK